MLAVRIIPCLDVDNGRVLKGTSFKELRDAGDPEELAERYNKEGADEIAFLDIGATYKSRETLVEVIRTISKKVFVPLAAGGGIKSVEDMRKLLNAGADKVVICSAALNNPRLITEGSKIFGSQCIVLSVDAKRTGMPGKWNTYVSGGRIDSGIDALSWAVIGERLGAGEILLNSIDMDGTKEGYDIELNKAVSEAVNIPVIASGGAGNPEQMAEAVLKGDVQAVLAASILHFGKYTINQIKTVLREKGVEIR